MKKYWTITQISFRNRNVYLAEVLARSLFLVIVLFIFFQLWSKVYSGMGMRTVAGFSRGDMLWYLMVTQVLLISFPKMEMVINEEIRSGAIAYQLNKPYDYINYQLATYWGDLLARFLLTAAVGILTAWLCIGSMHLDVAHLPLFLLVFIGSQLLNFAIMMAIALLAFVVEDAMPFVWIKHKLLFTIGGLMIPVTVFPSFLQQLCLWLPFSNILYGPATLAIHFRWDTFWHVLIAQLAWFAVCMAIARWLYAALVRRLDIQGG